MRGLSASFMSDLKQGGWLSRLTEAIKCDTDLLLEIRDNYLNDYFKGQSLLKLDRSLDNAYSLEIHRKFRVRSIEGMDFFRTAADVQTFVEALPAIKQRVVVHRAEKGGNEIEWEQLLIRANNDEPRLNTEYFIIDRQSVVPGASARFDLSAIFWSREHRRRGNEVPPVLLEVKYGQNPEIRELHEQLARYYKALPPTLEETAEEAQMILRQKIDVGLIHQPPDRLSTLRTHRISPSKALMRFGVVLVDYNPASRLFSREDLARLPFAERVDIFHVGFGFWSQRAGAASAGDDV